MSPAIVSPPISAVQPTMATIDWHIVLATLADGQVSAWIAEWPDCRVEAPSREAAIAELQSLLDEQLKTIEVIPIPVLPVVTTPVVTMANPWEPLYGLLEEDPDFAAWSDEFWAEKQRSHDDEEILSVEECLRVM